MESVFPGILFLSYFAPTVIRVALTAVFFSEAYGLWKKERKIEAAELALVGVPLFLGFLTQPAAIAGFLIVVSLAFNKKATTAFSQKTTALLALAMLLSLLITGPGLWAFDMPY